MTKNISKSIIKVNIKFHHYKIILNIIILMIKILHRFKRCLKLFKKIPLDT